ncbi:hypothetical protein PPYR_14750 [Photinus pyralis]|uniref:Uncharacterized protein n=1 Tax=Photinus pyralis TaxID=7054 RepID=A0A5N4A655_PHOPY|nr:uncharacterized protein LOC116180166 [Photinus pyralis]KAB0792791.1 hypothetical protein PPYR_14750 [Photinus pyralis]
MKKILDAHLDKSISIDQRLYNLWYATFYFRIWRYWLKMNKYSITENFVTLNAYTCVELNAHGFIQFVKRARNDAGNKTSETIFLPWLASSQPSEKMFRSLRSMTSTFSTIVNFNILEVMGRIHRLQLLNNITKELEPTYKFPREAHKKMGHDEIISLKFPSDQEIEQTVMQAKEDVVRDVREFDIKFVNDAWMQPILRVSVNQDELMDENEIHEDIHENSTNAEREMEDEDLVQEDKNLLKDIDMVHLKSHLLEKTGKSTLRVKLHSGREVVVKKSSILWLLTGDKNKLSSDRTLRVRSLDDKHRVDTHVTTKRAEQLNLELNLFSERYYAVYYDEDWFLGKVTNISQECDRECDEQIVSMKFLRKSLDTFVWPKKDDTDNISSKFILCGPVNLIGSHPFKIAKEDRNKIVKLYKNFKRH